MPNDRDPKDLNDLQKQVAAWLTEKKLRGCLMCGGQKLAIDDELYGPLKYEQGAIELGAIVPSAVVSCMNCGYIMHFAAKTIGIIK